MEKKKSLSYFMREVKEEIITKPGPASFKDENGDIVNFEIKVLSQEDITRISDMYKSRTIALDKNGHPYTNGNEVVYKTSNDSAKAFRHIIAEALVYPNLKDKDLMEYYNCVDITDMPMRVFSKSDEYTYVQRMVLSALGMTDDGDNSDDVEEAKN